MRTWNYDDLAHAVETELSSHAEAFKEYEDHWPTEGLTAVGLAHWGRMRPPHKWLSIFHLQNTFSGGEQDRITHRIACDLAERGSMHHLIESFGRQRNDSAVQWLRLALDLHVRATSPTLALQVAPTLWEVCLTGLRHYYMPKYSTHARLLKVASAYSILPTWPTPRITHALLDLADTFMECADA